MIMLMKDFLRVGSLAAVLLAGSCASPMNDQTVPVADPAANHPIVVEPSYQSVRFSFSVSNAGLMPDDAAKFDAFVADYMARGNGAITVSVPAGGYANATISYFGERLADRGVPRSRVLVGTRQVTDGDNRVELGFVGYGAHAANCEPGGDWSVNMARTEGNYPMPNFGCAVQNNIAAMVADPRDLLQPRDMGDASATRRKNVVGHYDKGEVTSATKTPEQSVTVSDVKNN